MFSPNPPALPDATLEFDPRGALAASNDLAAGLLGPEEFLAQLGSTAIGCEPADFAAWLEGDGPEIRRWRAEVVRADDVPLTVDVTARRQPGGGATCLVRDLGREQLIELGQLQLDVAFANSPIGMALFDTRGQYLHVNSALCELLGRDRDVLLGLRDQEITHPDDREADVKAAWRILAGELDRWQCEKRFLRPDGAIVWAIANLTFHRTADGHPLNWLGQFQDITPRKELERELRRLAERDHLTGLHNRRALDDALRRRLVTGGGGALLVLDLDGFKEVNDRHGHDVGDLLLVVVAEALKSAPGEEALVVRVGGDEFALMLTQPCPATAGRVAGRIQQLVADRCAAAVPGARVSASIGIVVFADGDPRGPDELLRSGDRAMYSAKRLGAGHTAEAQA